MTPQTLMGWILFAVLWVSAPIVGYAASDLIVTLRAREPAKRHHALAFGVFGMLALASLSVLIAVGGL